jgi:hypothetical protein
MEKPSMSQKFACFIILFTAAFSSLAQTTQTPPKKGRPDIPGTFLVELGVNRGLDAPSKFDLGLWGSRTVNIYYQYDIRILKSRFSFVPGIGLSLERYKFRNFRVLGYDAEDSLSLLLPTDAGITGIKKTQLITNYIEIPLELKYSSKPEDPSRSFKASIGGRIGYLYDSFRKLKYKSDGDLFRIKDKQDFNLTKIRYGVSGKIGIGNFAVFGYYNLTNLFEDGKGLGEKGVIKDFPTFTVGISLSSF